MVLSPDSHVAARGRKHWNARRLRDRERGLGAGATRVTDQGEDVVLLDELLGVGDDQVAFPFIVFRDQFERLTVDAAGAVDHLEVGEDPLPDVFAVLGLPAGQACALADEDLRDCGLRNGEGRGSEDEGSTDDSRIHARSLLAGGRKPPLSAAGRGGSRRARARRAGRKWLEDERLRQVDDPDLDEPRAVVVDRREADLVAAEIDLTEAFERRDEPLSRRALAGASQALDEHARG